MTRSPLLTKSAPSPAKGGAAANLGFWDGKLGYPHAWLVVSTVLVIGMILHRVSGPVPTSPVVLYVLSAPLAAVAVAVRIWRHSAWAQWLAGIPLAVMSTTFALALALLGGVVPVSYWNKIGFPTLWGSWPFVLISLLVMTNLAAAAAKRAWPMTRQNALFLLSHLGLLVVMIGGGISSVFQERSRIALFEGQFVDKAQTADGKDRVLPFQARLISFELETFPPTLVVAKSNDDLKPGTHFCKDGMNEKIGGWDVKVEKFLPKAIYNGSTFTASPWKTAAPAALVSATRNGKTSRGWISSGSMDVPNVMLPIEGEQVIAMPPPMPKKYRSVIEVKTAEGVKTLPIEVNKPAAIGSWRLYQVSYDDKAGAASEYSVIEAIEDKGVPVVFFGMFMVVAASAWHLWEGVEKKRK